MSKKFYYILTFLMFGIFITHAYAENDTSIMYTTHVENIGWQNYVTEENISGTEGQSLRLEGIKILLANPEYAGDIEYRTHIQNIGWESTWHKNNEMSGTEGQALRLEAIQIKLSGTIANHYDIYYRVHAQNFGWLGWTKNGEMAGTSGYSYRLEAIQIKLVKKGGADPTSSIEPYKSPKVSYQTHVQNIGWQGEVYDNEISGTQGQSLRIEGLKLKLNNAEYSGDILYRSHVQNIGWESTWHKNGELSGTTGRGLRLEAIQMKLNGTIANYYDIYYRTHVQNFGWLGWAKNGELSGTTGYSYRLEAIQIKLVKKNSGEKTGDSSKIAVDATEIKLDKTIAKINKGDSLKLNATVLPSNATFKNLIWTSSNPSVATVDSSGLVTAVGTGTATITVTNGNIKSQATINVIGGISLDKEEAIIKVNETIKLNATVNSSNKNITWTSDNYNIATVDSNGSVIPKRTGVVNITASNGIDKATAKITINGSRLHFINTNKENFADRGGDAILLESNGHFGLVDVGEEDYSKYGKYLLGYLDKFNINKLDFVILTHLHVDHTGGLRSLLEHSKKIDTIYMKTYTGKSSEASSGMDNRYNGIINIANSYGINIIYVDKDSAFKEESGKSGKISLGDMKIYFFNTLQRMVRAKKDTDSFDYYKSNYFISSTENSNSIVNLVRANGHNALLTGDIINYDILKGVFDNKVKSIYNQNEKLDVYKLPHHANFNCTGNTAYKVQASYYIVTGNINGKFDDGAYRITANTVNKDGEKHDSCFKLMANNDTTKAKKMMCNAYYSDNASEAVVVDFTSSTVTISGGGKGSDNTSRCN